MEMARRKGTFWQREKGPLCRVVVPTWPDGAERRTEAMRNARDAAAFEQPAKLLGIRRHVAPGIKHPRTGVAEHPRRVEDLQRAAVSTRNSNARLVVTEAWKARTVARASATAP